MSIVQAWTLPAQPPSGLQDQLVLQGKGFASPKSMYRISATDVGDASGGAITFTCTPDPRYISVVALMGFVVTGGAALVEYRLTVVGSVGNSSVDSGDSNFTAIIAGIAEKHWAPPPIVAVSEIIWQIDNTDTLPYTVTATVFNYDRDALNVAPLALILASLPRAGSTT